MKYYSIRVIEANSEEEAFEKIMCEDFCVEDPICDKVITLERFCNLMHSELQELGYVFPDWEYKAGDYLSGGADLSVKDQVLAIVEFTRNNQASAFYIEDVEGVELWQGIKEGTFTCAEFLRLIGYEG